MMTQVAFTAPHGEAAKTGLDVLTQGGSAVDAMVAAAAMISVQYPHMNSLGGDSFWLVQRAGKAPITIDGAGYAAKAADRDYYAERNYEAIPSRGADAALCVAGTLSGWQRAREYMEPHSPTMPLGDLLAPAIHAAKNGITVTESLAFAIKKCATEFSEFKELRALFYPGGTGLEVGESLRNPGLAHLLDTLAHNGLEDFYWGETGEAISASLLQQGSPISLQDLHTYRAQYQRPLATEISHGKLFNMSAPTQGIASLLILAIYDALNPGSNTQHWSEAQRVHVLIEAIKRAFIVRDEEVADTSALSSNWPNILSEQNIRALANEVNMDQTLAWPHEAKPGDTVWMGAVDKHGTMVSFIQSIYWEFGSGIVIPEFGLIWNNRGSSFSLDPNRRTSLQPRTKPFHTLNPAAAILNDGSRMVYGTMGGEGQPQTQAALFSRHIFNDVNLQDAIADGRWLLGRTWGDVNTDLKMEKALYDRVGSDLETLGHKISVVPQSEQMGHAGGIRLYQDGHIDCATDPRSDGLALVANLSHN